MDEYESILIIIGNLYAIERSLKQQLEPAHLSSRHMIINY